MRKKHLTILGIVLTAACGIGVWQWIPETPNHPAIPEVESELAGNQQLNTMTPTPIARNRPIIAKNHSDESQTIPALKWLDPIILRTLNAETTWNETGTEKTITSIVEADFHHPYLRIEERYSVDPASGGELLIKYLPSTADTLLIQLAENATEEEFRALETRLGLHRAEILKGTSILRAKVANFASIERLPELIDSLLSDPRLIDVAEPDYLSRSFRKIPNDPQFIKQKGFDTDPHNGRNADIDAPEAWSIRTDASSVVVAVVDSGINLSHDDLSPNLWVNVKEQANGIDDDHNGFIDDLHGANLITTSGDPGDDNGHGSLVAGVIGARGNDGVGVAGVAWKVQLMALKHSDSSGIGLYSDSIEAIQYAIDQGADIINNSWGGSGYSKLLESTLRAASDEGIIITTAAGNEGNNLSETPIYPAAYSIANQLVVGASDDKNRRSSFSNYDRELVHLLAPEGAYGSWIQENDSYHSSRGTSFSAPYVAGTAALLSAEFPQQNAAQIINRILDSVEQFEAFNKTVFSQGRLNTYRALAGESNIPENDLFANATILEPKGETVLGNLSRATTEINEPGAFLNPKASSVWYSWISPQSDTVHLNLGSPGFQGVIAAYSGSSIEALNAIGTAFTPSGQNAKLSFAADSGTTYFVQVGKTSGLSGLYSLTLAPAPPNDLVANATVLNGQVFSTEGSTILATTQEREVIIHPSGAGNSVWYQWTAPQSGPYYLTVDSEEGQTFASVFGGTPEALIKADFDLDQGLPNRLLLEVQSGRKYYFGIDSQSDNGVRFNLAGQYLEAPRITVQPVDVAASQGHTAQFSVSVLGLGERSYQWFHDGEAIQENNSPFLLLSDLQAEDAGTYHVEIQINGILLQSRYATLSLEGGAFRILEHPQSKVVPTGSPLKVSVFAQSPEAVNYKWYQNGQLIAGQTGADLIISNASTKDTAYYEVELSSGGGTLRSKSAYVRVVEGNSIVAGTALADTPFRDHKFVWVRQAGDYFFAFGQDETLAFSDDGRNWHYTTAVRADDLYWVSHGKDLYVLSTEQGLYWSSNLFKWEKGTTQDHVSRVRQVAFGNDVFVAASTQGILRSADGKDWTLINAGVTGVDSVVWADDKFLAQGRSGEVITSSDGSSWEQIGTANLTDLYGLLYDRGVYWTSQRIIAHSSDGVSWTQLTLPEDWIGGFVINPDTGRRFLMTPTVFWEWEDDHWRPIQEAPDGHAVVGLGIDGDQAIVTIAGVAQRLSEFKGPELLEERMYGAFFANGKFGAWSGDRLYESPDGINWNFVNTNLDKGLYDGVVYGKDTYVTDSAFGPGLSSMTEHNLNLRALTFGKDTFVGLSGRDLVYSPDGESWTVADTVESSLNRMLLFDGKKFFFISGAGIRTSIDGKVWTTDSATGVGFDFILYANDTFLGVSEGGGTWTSTTGISWQRGGDISYPDVFTQVDDVELFNGKFYAIYFGILYESSDGSSWELVNQELQGYDAKYMTSGNDRLLLFSELGVAVWSVEGGGGGVGEPFITLSGITPGSTITYGDTITVTANAIGRGSTIETIQVFENESLLTQFNPPLSSFQYTPKSIGTHTLSVRVTDSSGQTAEKTIAIHAERNLYSQLPGGDPHVSDITYFKGAFYGAGPGGLVFQSLDGATWNRIQTPAIDDLNGFYTNPLGISAVSKGGELLFSTDGTAWHLIPLSEAAWIPRQYEPSFIFVPTSVESGWISTNGVDWFSAKTGLPVAGDPSAVPDLPYEFVDLFGLILASPGKPLIETSPAGNENVEDTAKLGNSVYEAVAEQGVFKTEDGQTWQEYPLAGIQTYNEVTIRSAGNALFVVDERRSRIRYFSGNGQDWESVPSGPTALGNIVFQDGVFYCGSETAFNQSSDGIHWQTVGEWGTGSFPRDTRSSEHRELLASPLGFLSLASTEDDRVVVSYSKDGKEWLRYGRPDKDSQIDALAGGNGTLLSAVRNQTYKLNSSGIWEFFREPRITDIATWGNGVFLDSSFAEERIWRSTDGMEWTDVVLPAWLDQGKPDALFHDGRNAFWISYNGEDLLGRSVDGLSWEQKTYPGTLEPGDNILEFEGKLFAERFMSDDNATTWVDSFPGVRGVKLAKTNEDLLAVVRNNDGPSTVFIFEANAWNEISTPVQVDAVSGVAATQDEFFVVFGNYVYSSKDGSNWNLVSRTTRDQRAVHLGENVFFHTAERLNILSPSTLDIGIEQVSTSNGEFGVGDDLALGILLKNTGEEETQTNTSLELQVLLSQQNGAWGSGPDGYFHSVTVPVDSLQLPVGATKLLNTTIEIPETIKPGRYFLSVHISNDPLFKDVNSRNDYWIGDFPSIAVPERKLTMTLAGQGTVISGKSLFTIPHNQSLQLIPNPSIGHEFSGWSGDVAPTIEIADLLMDSDKEVVANFTLRQFSVAIAIAGSGSVSGVPQSGFALFGDNLELIAGGNEGWQFLGWFGDRISQETSLSIEVGRDLNLSARFVQSLDSFLNNRYTETEKEDPEIGGRLGDPDRNGFTNLQEYLFGVKFETGGLPHFEVFRDGNDVCLVYPRSLTTIGNERLEVWHSQELSEWDKTGITERVVRTEGDLEYVEARLQSAGEDSVFFEIRALSE